MILADRKRFMIKKNSIFLVGLVLVLGLLFSGCEKSGGQAERSKSFQGHTMGTTYSVKYFSSEPEREVESLKASVDELLIDFNQGLSTYINDSEISRFNKLDAHKWFEISEEFKLAFLSAKEIVRLSQGAFDPTVMSLVNLWGFGPEGPKNTPSDQEVSDVLQTMGLEHLELDSQSSRLKKLKAQTQLDFSASAKGLGVDQVANYLEEQDIHNYMVEIGGEVRVAGQKSAGRPWVMAVEKPQEGSSRAAQKIIALNQDYALATSGSYRNFYENEGKLYQHTLNPVTGKPVRNALVSVSVIDLDKSCMKADSWATALMVMGPEKAKQVSIDLNLATYFIIQEGSEKREFVEFESPRFKKLMENSALKEN